VAIADNRQFRWFAIAFLAWGLAAATHAALRLNFERAPLVHVRWAPSVDDSTRTQLQTRFGLTEGQYDSGTTWVYVLMSPTAANIQALVESPAVEDTHHIDRVRFGVSPGAPRRGPFITAGRLWLPRALQWLTLFFTAAGGLAVIVAKRSAIERSLPTMRARLVETGPAWVLCGALILLWMLYLALLREGAEERAPFRIGDWLVSYQVGFVRRGLPGSPILALTTLLGAAPERIVLWLQVALYTLFFVFLFWGVRRKRLDVWFLAFLFSPAALLFPLYDPAVIGRKDVLFFTVFALYAVWMPAPERRWTAVATCALGVATTLSHELFFFFTPYFFVMRILHDKGAVAWRRFLPELGLFGGALVALFVVSTLGANLQGEAQCADLLRRGFDEQLCDGILRYPATTIHESMLEVAVSVRGDGYLFGYSVAFALAALPLPLFLARARRGHLVRLLVFGSLAAFVLTLPMFVIARDWGRLLNINVIALGVLIGTFVLEDRRAGGPARNARAWWIWFALLLGVVLYLTTWNVRHCCTDPLRAGIFAAD
jgi:hypothetical protein